MIQQLKLESLEKQRDSQAAVILSHELQQCWMASRRRCGSGGAAPPAAPGAAVGLGGAVRLRSRGAPEPSGRCQVLRCKAQPRCADKYPELVCQQGVAWNGLAQPDDCCRLNAEPSPSAARGAMTAPKADKGPLQPPMQPPSPARAPGVQGSRAPAAWAVQSSSCISKLGGEVIGRYHFITFQCFPE